MADDATLTPAAAMDAGDQETPTGASTNDQVPEVDGEGLIKALAAERKQNREAQSRAKAAEQKLQEIEDAQKSEAEKLQERLVRAEQEAAAARVELLRERIAREEDVPHEFIDRLRGDTEDTIREDAKSFVAALPAREGPDPRKPAAPRARDGADPDTTAGLTTDEKVARAFEKAAKSR